MYRQYMLSIVASMLAIVAAAACAATLEESTASEMGFSADEEEQRQIVGARQLPYAAVGRLEGPLICTAAIVAHPRIVVTAAHCVIDPVDGVIKGPILFQPGYRAETDLGRFYGELWNLGSPRQYGALSANDAANDWAILVLEHSPNGIRPLGLQRCGGAHFHSLHKEALLPAYSIDIADGQALSVDPICSIKDQVWGLLFHDCEVNNGASGAPLLRLHDGWYVVIGIERSAVILPGSDHEYGSAASSDAFMDSLEAVFSAADAEQWEALSAILSILKSDVIA